MIKKFLFSRSDIMLHGFDLLVRLYLLKVFFQSGMVKIQSWQSTLDLFAYEYSVPLLPPEIAAYTATAYAYSLTDYYNMVGMMDHMLWGAMILVYILYGPSPLSV